MAWPKGVSRKQTRKLEPTQDLTEENAAPIIQEILKEEQRQVLEDKPSHGIPDQKPNGSISGKPTKPWDRKLQGNKPWRRDITALTKNDPSFHCRWVNNDSIDARIERGYEIADPKKWGKPTDRIVDDGSPLGRRIVRRDMTLMEIPQEGKKFFQDEQEKVLKARKRDAREMVKKQAEELLQKAGFAVAVVDKSKVERDGHIVTDL